MTIIKCNKDNPWDNEVDVPDGCRVEHEDVSEIGEQEDGWPGGDIVTYRCNVCGVMWCRIGGDDFVFVSDVVPDE